MIKSHQHKLYKEQGYDEIQAGHYASWATRLPGPNGYTLDQKTVGRRIGGTIGKPGQSLLSQSALDELYQQCLTLWQNINDGVPN